MVLQKNKKNSILKKPGKIPNSERQERNGQHGGQSDEGNSTSKDRRTPGTGDRAAADPDVLPRVTEIYLSGRC